MSSHATLCEQIVAHRRNDRSYESTPHLFTLYCDPAVHDLEKDTKAGFMDYATPMRLFTAVRHRACIHADTSEPTPEAIRKELTEHMSPDRIGRDPFHYLPKHNWATENPFHQEYVAPVREAWQNHLADCAANNPQVANAYAAAAIGDPTTGPGAGAAMEVLLTRPELPQTHAVIRTVTNRPAPAPEWQQHLPVDVMTSAVLEDRLPEAPTLTPQHLIRALSRDRMHIMKEVLTYSHEHHSDNGYDQVVQASLQTLRDYSQELRPGTFTDRAMWEAAVAQPELAHNAAYATALFQTRPQELFYDVAHRTDLPAAARQATAQLAARSDCPRERAWAVAQGARAFTDMPDLNPNDDPVIWHIVSDHFPTFLAHAGIDAMVTAVTDSRHLSDGQRDTLVRQLFDTEEGSS